VKLLMENWRKFVAETERTKNYGDLYLFENDSVQKVSFYDRFSTLNESDDDFELFLEQWEKSVDYMLNNLSEQEENYTASLQAGTQAFVLLQRGGAAVGKVMNFAKKLKDKGNLGKIGGVMLRALAAGAAAVAINSLLGAGADASEFQQAMAQVADAVGAVDASVGQAVEQIAQNPEAALEVMPQLDQAVEQSAQQLSQVDDEAVQQMAQEAEKVSQQIPEGDDFASMFEDTLSQTTAAGDIELSKSVGEQLASQIFDNIKGKLPPGVNIHDSMSINGAHGLGVDQEQVHNSFHETMKSSLEGAGLQGGENLETSDRKRGITITVHVSPAESGAPGSSDSVQVGVSLMKDGKVVEVLDEFVAQI